MVEPDGYLSVYLNHMLTVRPAWHSAGRRASERQREMSVPVDVPGDFTFSVTGVNLKCDSW